jgi:simple sugar transport system ATP-binding protein
MATANKKVNEVIEKHNFSIAAEQKISDLTVGQMQQAEIVKMLYRNVDFLILDEPTAVLTEKEIESFFHTIRELCENNKALILITHKLHEIKRISHRVAIMRKGRMIGDYDTDDLSVNDISSMMIGRETASTIPKLERKQDRRNPVLRFEKVAVKRKKQDRPLLQDISFTAYGGEILGFAGVGGNGLGTLEAVLGGFLSVTSGSIYHRGQDITAKNTRKLRESGLAYVPSDRLQVGSALQARVKENIIVADRHRYFPKGLMDERSVDAYADEILRQYEIKAQADMPVGTLSGGNIQKLILAREMHRLQDYIVFSEPTWGLDVASGNFVYDQIKNLRDDGAAVIVISSNLDEILAIADRIIVFYRGMIVLQIDNDDSSNISKQMIGDYMLGIKK